MPRRRLLGWTEVTEASQAVLVPRLLPSVASAPPRICGSRTTKLQYTTVQP